MAIALRPTANYHSLLLISLCLEDIQLEKKSKLTEEVLLDVYNTNISLTELQDIQNLARLVIPQLEFIFFSM